jgi:hypothetical protein
MGAVANAADVHAGAQADVFEGGKRFNFALVVNVFLALSHNQGINIGLKRPIANGNLSICACSALFGSCNVRGSVSGAVETPQRSKLVE